MDVYIRLEVSCRLITTIIRQRKKDIGEIEKIEIYSQKNLRIVCVCMCVCVYVCACVDYICVLLSNIHELII